MKTKINGDILWFVGAFFIISLIAISSAAIYTSKDLGNLVLKQTIWYFIGGLVVLIIYKLGNKFLYQATWGLYIIGIISLILLLFLGKPINNSRCWFVIPGIGSVQPSEFMKLFIMLALGNLIYQFRKEKTAPTIKEEFVFILKTGCIVLIPAILTFLQPDTGAVIIYLIIYMAMMFLSGIRIRWFLIALGICLPGVFLVGGIYFFNEELFVQVFGTSFYYRLERLFMWKDGVGLQLENAISAIGSSGLFGYGFKKTPIYFPEAATDFIFAVYASNFGLIGVTILLILFLLFDYYIISLMRKKNNNQSKYILAGILGMLLFQQVQNIGMTIGLLPITGITLPFISYGGSSLISYMIIIGIIINIASEKNKSYK